MSRLQNPVRIGDRELSNRIIMAPLTCGRVSAGRVTNDLMREYYQPRASAEEATVGRIHLQNRTPVRWQSWHHLQPIEHKSTPVLPVGPACRGVFGRRTF
jgi:hypothetical protein